MACDAPLAMTWPRSSCWEGLSRQAALPEGARRIRNISRGDLRRPGDLRKAPAGAPLAWPRCRPRSPRETFEGPCAHCRRLPDRTCPIGNISRGDLRRPATSREPWSGHSLPGPMAAKVSREDLGTPRPNRCRPRALAVDGAAQSLAMGEGRCDARSQRRSTQQPRCAATSLAYGSSMRSTSPEATR